MAVVVMGVAGAGKSAVGRRLARWLRVPFCEGDALHPPANIAKMRAGIALTDRDRAPWLAAIGRRIGRCPTTVVACSALKRRYRDRLRRAGAGMFVFLDPPPHVLAARLAGRSGHFMPASLLASQLATLERPAGTERVLRVTGRRSIGASTAIVARWVAVQRRRSVARRGTRSSCE